MWGGGRVVQENTEKSQKQGVMDTKLQLYTSVSVKEDLTLLLIEIVKFVKLVHQNLGGDKGQLDPCQEIRISFYQLAPLADKKKPSFPGRGLVAPYLPLVFDERA